MIRRWLLRVVARACGANFVFIPRNQPIVPDFSEAAKAVGEFYTKHPELLRDPPGDDRDG